MATEGPQLHDGGNLIAAANYYNPGVALSGPGGSGQFLAMIQSTTADRTALLVASQGVDIAGILQNQPAQGDAADICFNGVSKAVAGAAVTRGDKLMVDASGRLITATSTNFVVGVALESAGAANVIFTVLVRSGGKI